MHWPYGQYFIALHKSTIFSLAGVHHFPKINDNAYRCLFRGAQLPKYTPKWSMNIFNSGIHFAYFLYIQILFVQQYNSNAEFYITTNIENPNAGVSSRLNKIMMPKLAKMGYWELTHENVDIYHTKQNVWKVNVNKYMEAREQWLFDEKNTAEIELGCLLAFSQMTPY